MQITFIINSTDVLLYTKNFLPQRLVNVDTKEIIQILQNCPYNLCTHSLNVNISRRKYNNRRSL
jgi:hypothetical protein